MSNSKMYNSHSREMSLSVNPHRPYSYNHNNRTLNSSSLILSIKLEYARPNRRWWRVFVYFVNCTTAAKNTLNLKAITTTVVMQPKKKFTRAHKKYFLKNRSLRSISIHPFSSAYFVLLLCSVRRSRICPCSDSRLRNSHAFCCQRVSYLVTPSLF